MPRKKKQLTIEAPIGNYYGTPTCREEDNSYVFVINDYSGESKANVSQEFFEAWCKEFKNPKKRTQK
jgi:hypothetical protein